MKKMTHFKGIQRIKKNQCRRNTITKRTSDKLSADQGGKKTKTETF